MGRGCSSVVVMDCPWLWRTSSKVKVEICKCCLNVSRYRNEHRFSHTNRRETHQKRWKKMVSFIMCFDMSILVFKIQIDTAQNTTIPSVPVQWRQQRQRRISHSQQISHQIFGQQQQQKTKTKKKKCMGIVTDKKTNIIQELSVRILSIPGRDNAKRNSATLCTKVSYTMDSP